MTRAELFDALLDEIAERVAAKLARSGPAFYSLASPPPHHTWRAVLEAHRRGELAITKRGRCAFVDRGEYERWIAGGALARKPRPQLVAVRDVATLGQLGVKLRGAR